MQHSARLFSNHVITDLAGNAFSAAAASVWVLTSIAHMKVFEMDQTDEESDESADENEACTEDTSADRSRTTPKHSAKKTRSAAKRSSAKRAAATFLVCKADKRSAPRPTRRLRSKTTVAQPGGDSQE